MTVGQLIQRDNLLSAIDMLDLVPQRAGIPSSDYVRVKNDGKKIQMNLASDVVGEVWLKAPGGSAEKEYLLERRMLLPFLRVGRDVDKPFGWRETDEQVHVVQGSRSAKLTKVKMAVSGYGTLGLSGKKWMLSDKVKKILLVAGTCSTTDPSMPELNCIYLRKNLVYASNRITLLLGNGVGVAEELIFPPTVLPLVSSNQVKDVLIGKDGVRLESPVGFVEAPVSSIARKKFPRQKIAEQVALASKWPLLGAWAAKLVGKVIARLEEYVASISRQTVVVKIVWSDESKKSHWTAETRQGTFSEVMLMEKKWAASGSVELPLEYVSGVLSHIAEHGKTVVLRADEKKRTPYLIDGAGIHCLVARRMK